MCVGSPAQVHVDGLTCVSRGSRACSGVRVRAVRHDRHRCAQNADHLAHNSPFLPVFAEVVCSLGTSPPQPTASPPPNGGNCAIRRMTRRGHAVSQRLMLQNPHRHRYGGRSAADKTWAQRWDSQKTRPARLKQRPLPVLGVQGELFRAHAHTRPMQGEKFRAQDTETWQR